MKRIPLKSKFGCQRCRERRKKCDEVKPKCGECARLGFNCRWAPLNQVLTNAKNRSPTIVFEVNIEVNVEAKAENDVKSMSKWKAPDRSQDLVKAGSGLPRFFDSPSILRTSAVPDNGTAECKPILQYLSEKGAGILNIPAQRLPPNHGLNLFREAFLMASKAPVLLEAHLCVSAGHLCQVQPSYERVALRYYNIVMSKLREELIQCVEKPPAEWACAVAANLSFYELITFHSAQSRLAHLVGFHRLVEARSYHRLPWSRLKALLEQYIHSLAKHGLFHHDVLISQRPVAYVDSLIELLNDGGRLLGREIAGVPEDLTAVAYRLAILNVRDINQPPWDAELVATTAKLTKWMQAPHALMPSGAGLRLVAELYHAACTCLLQNIIDRTADATDEVIAACLGKACDLLEAPEMQFRPFNSMVWPLTVLSVFAVDRRQQSTFRQPILKMIDTAKIEGYRSVLSFLSLVEGEGLGPRVFLRHDLLGMVHM